MAKVMFVSPRRDIQERAMMVVSQESLPHCGDILYRVANQTSVQGIAEEARREHVSVIIARGKQAELLKSLVTCPIVDIRLSGQELGVMVEQAKTMVSVPHPAVAVVGMHNMYSDMKEFDKLFNVDLRQYFIDEVDDINTALEQAVQDGADIIIGGEIANRFSAQRGIPSIFANSGREGIATALHQAELVALALDMEQENTAQTRALLDYSFNGIVKLDDAGVVQSLNNVAETLLDLRPGAAPGMPIEQLWPEMTADTINEVIHGGREIYARVLQCKSRTFLINLAPITTGERISGIILSFQESKALTQMETNLRQALYRQGHTASFRFANFDYVKAPEMKQLISMAHLYAKSEAPLLISGDEGTETRYLAQAVHNESTRQKQPFVVFQCGCVEQENCSVVLFGKAGSENALESHGVIADANDGTLLLDDIEKLSADAQHRLLRYMQTGAAVPCGAYTPQRLNVRIIAVTSCDLAHYVEQHRFLSGLYYAVNVLSLAVPPLRRRREDILPLADKYVAEQSRRYSRYISLTEGAKRELAMYPWPGNVPQLKSFCERLLITSPHRSVNDEYISALLAKAYPIAVTAAPEQEVNRLTSPEAVTIARLMAKYAGNREMIAHEMGISKTTLWRKMKAAGINDSIKNVYDEINET